MPVVPGPTQYLMGVCRLTRRSQDEKTSSYICRTRFKVDLPALRSQVSLPGNTKNRTTLLHISDVLSANILDSFFPPQVRRPSHAPRVHNGDPGVSIRHFPPQQRRKNIFSAIERSM